ncbi:phosphonoacetaldehyde hydrolase [Paenibacillus phyllosphaerae]|uniref:Phosphonoacetaldehyde hydrolase n=1 Tax=Paenibacillus phyllosphaerae TaxID=274593 RepID=A0A7W5FN18_9BACL|nr:phosphonoacetaldehyde hydrolase [Paenibacillus phyllosphaerae]MBB3110682.1 phosphonoacetaldehyde hydrolase [Paenibacillus phyllosphaerae]
MIKAVMLDWAGTMVDYGSFAPVAAFRRVFAQRGIDVADADIRRPMGRMKIDHLRDICHAPAVQDAWIAKYGAPANEADVQSLYEAFEPTLLAIVHEYAEPVPGALALVERLRASGIKIGTTTGYTRPMMDLLMPAAAKQGYAPDSTVTPDEVAGGRPHPWMLGRNAELLGVYPARHIVKCGDTEADMREGRNAGAWTVGVVFGGNELGLSEAETAALPEEERQRRYDEVAGRLFAAGAHYVIPEIGKLDSLFTDIESKLNQGEQP